MNAIREAEVRRIVVSLRYLEKTETLRNLWSILCLLSVSEHHGFDTDSFAELCASHSAKLLEEETLKEVNPHG